VKLKKSFIISSIIITISGTGTDEDVVLMLLTSRTNVQRQQIKEAYKTAYGKVSLKGITQRLATSNGRIHLNHHIQPVISVLIQLHSWVQKIKIFLKTFDSL